MKKFVQSIWKEWKGELLLTALFLPLFWYLMDSGYLNDSAWLSARATVLLGAVAAAALVLALRRKLTWERAAFLLLLCGLILRMNYSLGTDTYVRNHDYGDISWVYDENGNAGLLGFNAYGHAPYILYIYLFQGLADFNRGQFYHPPLFHALAALSMRATHKVLGVEDLILLLESAKVISCLASCYTLLMVPKICRELRIRQGGKCLAVGVMAFLPMFYLMAGWINNDGVVMYFMTWIVLYTLRWYKKPSWGNTLMLALGFGLGMESKASCALLAFFTGGFMLRRLARTLSQMRKGRKAELKKLLEKFAGFALVAVPLGMAYSVRNYLKFGQSFNFVLELDIPEVPVRDFLSRFLLFPFQRVFTPVFADSEEYNLNLFLLKTASMGEFSYETALEPWGRAILAANLTLILLALAGIVIVWRREKLFFWRLALPGEWVLLYVSLVVFSWKYPYTCSMDARYLPVTVLFGALCLGKAVQELSGAGQRVWTKAYCCLSFLALAVLAVSGGYFFMNC